jgi:hypothetical protein
MLGQRLHDPIAGRIGAETADPGRAQSEPRQPHTGIALGAGMIDQQRRRAAQRFAGWRRERQHRLAECDQIEVTKKSHSVSGQPARRPRRHEITKKNKQTKVFFVSS